MLWAIVRFGLSASAFASATLDVLVNPAERDGAAVVVALSCKRKMAIFKKQREVSGYTACDFSSTGFASGFGTGSVRSDLIAHDFKLPECAL